MYMYVYRYGLKVGRRPFSQFLYVRQVYYDTVDSRTQWIDFSIHELSKYTVYFRDISHETDYCDSQSLYVRQVHCDTVDSQTH